MKKLAFIVIFTLIVLMAAGLGSCSYKGMNMKGWKRANKEMPSLYNSKYKNHVE